MANDYLIPGFLEDFMHRQRAKAARLFLDASGKIWITDSEEDAGLSVETDFNLAVELPLGSGLAQGSQRLVLVRYEYPAWYKQRIVPGSDGRDCGIRVIGGVAPLESVAAYKALATTVRLLHHQRHGLGD